MIVTGGVGRIQDTLGAGHAPAIRIRNDRPRVAGTPWRGCKVHVGQARETAGCLLAVASRERAEIARPAALCLNRRRLRNDLDALRMATSISRPFSHFPYRARDRLTDIVARIDAGAAEGLPVFEIDRH